MVRTQGKIKGQRVRWGQEDPWAERPGRGPGGAAAWQREQELGWGRVRSHRGLRRRKAARLNDAENFIAQ